MIEDRLDRKLWDRCAQGDRAGARLAVRSGSLKKGDDDA
jgi:hypothetical protein